MLHFDQQATAYHRYRPAYPAALYAWLLAQTTARHAAWDAGTGNGQVAVPIGAHFAQVYATDTSAAQLAQAPRRDNITYLQCPAEHTPIPTNSIDLITVAQACHWFDGPAFFAEARRVSRPGAVMALWGYGLIRISPAIDALVDALYTLTRLYWDAARAHIDDGYAQVFTDFAQPLGAPTDLEIKLWWTQANVLGYLATWSGLRAYIHATGHDPLVAWAHELAAAWGPGSLLAVRFPLFIRAGVL